MYKFVHLCCMQCQFHNLMLFCGATPPSVVGDVWSLAQSYAVPERQITNHCAAPRSIRNWTNCSFLTI